MVNAKVGDFVFYHPDPHDSHRDLPALVTDIDRSGFHELQFGDGYVCWARHDQMNTPLYKSSTVEDLPSLDDLFEIMKSGQDLHLPGRQFKIMGVQSVKGHEGWWDILLAKACSSFRLLYKSEEQCGVLQVI